MMPADIPGELFGSIEEIFFMSRILFEMNNNGRYLLK